MPQARCRLWLESC